jgi:purine-binding chemotaxis protein CheW
VNRPPIDFWNTTGTLKKVPSTAPLPTGRSVLVVVAGGTRCGLPLEQLVETMRPMPLERVANAPSYLLGLSIIRGVPIPVVDLGALLGRAVVRATPTARFVTLRVGPRQVAVSVDAVIGVKALPAGTAHELPPLLGASDVVSSVAALDRELVSVLDGGHVFPDEVWARVFGAAS